MVVTLPADLQSRTAKSGHYELAYLHFEKLTECSACQSYSPSVRAIISSCRHLPIWVKSELYPATRTNRPRKFQGLPAQPGVSWRRSC